MNFGACEICHVGIGPNDKRCQKHDNLTSTEIENVLVDKVNAVMGMMSIYNPATGATSCRSCGQPVQCGHDATKYGGVTCGDCLEYRTPLKQEIAILTKERNEAIEVIRLIRVVMDQTSPQALSLRLMQILDSTTTGSNVDRRTDDIQKDSIK